MERAGGPYASLYPVSGPRGTVSTFWHGSVLLLRELLHPEDFSTYLAFLLKFCASTDSHLLPASILVRSTKLPLCKTVFETS